MTAAGHSRPTGAQSFHQQKQKGKQRKQMKNENNKASNLFCCFAHLFLLLLSSAKVTTIFIVDSPSGKDLNKSEECPSGTLPSIHLKILVTLAWLFYSIQMQYCFTLCCFTIGCQIKVTECCVCKLWYKYYYKYSYRLQHYAEVLLMT